VGKEMSNEKEIRFIEMFCGVGGFRLGLEGIRYIQPTMEEGRDSRKPKTQLHEREQKRFRCVWANDNDKYACQVYRERFGGGTQSATTKSRQAKSTKKSRGGRKRTPDKGGRSLLPGGCESTSSGIWHEESKLLEGDIREVPTSDIPNHDLITAGFPCQSFSVAGRRRGFQDITRGTLFFEICRIIRDKRPSHLLLENVKGLLSHDGGRTFAIILLSLDELGYDAEWFVANTKYYLPQNRERVFIFGIRREGK